MAALTNHLSNLIIIVFFFLILPLALFQLLPADAAYESVAWYLFFKSMVAGLAIFVLKQLLTVYKPAKIENLLSRYSVRAKTRKVLSGILYILAIIWAALFSIASLHDLAILFL